MKGDFSRDSFDARARFSSVRMQQGRVQLDADFNEQVDIVLRRDELTARDVIGPSGAPLEDAGFAIGAPGRPAGDFSISAGRLYLDGMLVENLADCTFGSQPDPPADQSPNTLTDGFWLIYVDAWHRHETALDQPGIREVALGGPDTTTRTRAVWQVRAVRLPVRTREDAHCGYAFDAWDNATRPSTGRLRARDSELAPVETPCVLPPTAGYRGLENQLYRVEVHAGGAIGDVTFKWSRDNAAIETAVEAVAVDGPRLDLVVADPGKDSVRAFAVGQWIEISDDDDWRAQRVGVLAQISAIDYTHRTISIPTPAALSVDPQKHARVRRWEGVSVAAADADGDAEWIELEQGVEVQFDDGADTYYRPGDYWIIPARTAVDAEDVTGNVIWPASAGQAEFRPARGVRHRYGRLAVVHRTTAGDGSVTIKPLEDCRPTFVPLTGMTRLHYLGGDGQEVARGTARLPQPLRVGFSHGSNGVSGRRVRFTTVSGNGWLIDGGNPPAQPSIEVVTGPDGVAICEWALDPAGPGSQRVTAELLDPDGDPSTHPAIHFSASFGQAGCGEIEIRPGNGPSADLQALVDAIPEGGDAVLCFHPGLHQLAETVIFHRKGDLILKGGGPGTRITVRNREVVLLFRGCRSVQLQDLAVQATVARDGEPHQPTVRGLRGAVSVYDSQRVTADRLHIRSGQSTRRRACCLLIKGHGDLHMPADIEPAFARVRVRDCELQPGHAQNGLQLIDVSRAEVTGNHIEVAPTRLSLRDLVLEPAVLAELARAVVAAVRFGRSAPPPPPRDTAWTPVLRLHRQTFRVATAPELQDLWGDVLRANAAPRETGREAVRRHVEQLGRRALVAAVGGGDPDVLAGRQAAFDALSRRLQQQIRATGTQAIVVGGREAPRPAHINGASTRVAGGRRPDLHIVGNSIRGFAEGIHLGLSFNSDRSSGARAPADERDRNLRLFRTLVAENTIFLHVDATARSRHGIFVGNSQSTTIRDNLVEVVFPEPVGIPDGTQGYPPVTGIRVHGSQGPLLLIERNHTTWCRRGVYAVALNRSDAPLGRWRLVDNVNVHCAIDEDTSPAMP